MMGSVKLQIVHGDIIHEKTDVIVNSTGFQGEHAGMITHMNIFVKFGLNDKSTFHRCLQSYSDGSRTHRPNRAKKG